MTTTAMTKAYDRYLDACRRASLKPFPVSHFANVKQLVATINSIENLGATGEAYNEHEPATPPPAFGIITIKLSKVQRAKLRKLMARRLDIQRFNTRWDHVIPVTVLQAANIPYRPA